MTSSNYCYYWYFNICPIWRIVGHAKPFVHLLALMKLLDLTCQLALCFLFGTRTVQGVESNPQPEILLGMSTVLSGPAADLGKDMRKGVLAGLERANRWRGERSQTAPYRARRRLRTVSDRAQHAAVD